MTLSIEELKLLKTVLNHYLYLTVGRSRTIRISKEMLILDLQKKINNFLDEREVK